MVSAGEFRFQFCNFLVRCSVYIVCPAVLSCSNLKLHQMLEVKNIFFKEEKIILQLTFNPAGLTLTGFRTTRPSLPVYKLVWLLLTTFLLQGVECTVLHPKCSGFLKEIEFLAMRSWGEAAGQFIKQSVLHACYVSLTEVTNSRRFSVDAGITKSS